MALRLRKPFETSDLARNLFHNGLGKYHDASPWPFPNCRCAKLAPAMDLRRAARRCACPADARAPVRPARRAAPAGRNRGARRAPRSAPERRAGPPGATSRGAADRPRTNPPGPRTAARHVDDRPRRTTRRRGSARLRAARTLARADALVKPDQRAHGRGHRPGDRARARAGRRRPGGGADALGAGVAWVSAAPGAESARPDDLPSLQLPVSRRGS